MQDYDSKTPEDKIGFNSAQRDELIKIILEEIKNKNFEQGIQDTKDEIELLRKKIKDDLNKKIDDSKLNLIKDKYKEVEKIRSTLIAGIQNEIDQKKSALEELGKPKKEWLLSLKDIIGIVLSIIGIVLSTLLVYATIQQTIIIGNQNEILQDKSDFENKTLYEEQAKYVINLMQSEIDDANKDSINNEVQLQPSTIENVVRTSKKIIPYSYSSENSSVSTEKGDILSFILTAKISSDSRNEILTNGSFHDSYINSVLISDKNISYLFLNNTFAKEIIFRECNLDNITFENLNVEKLIFENCENIDRLHLLNGNISFLSFTDSKMTNPKISNINSSKMILNYCVTKNMIIANDSNNRGCKSLEIYNSSITPKSFGKLDFKRMSNLGLYKCEVKIDTDICISNKGLVKIEKSKIISSEFLFENCDNNFEIKHSILKTKNKKFEEFASAKVESDYVLYNPNTKNIDSSVKDFKEFYQKVE